MAGSSWFQWLAGLFSVQPDPPAPGTHEADLEMYRVGGLLNKERSKPPGERDEELVRTLALEFCTRKLESTQAWADLYASKAATCERPVAHECCAASVWVRQRCACSYRALQDYYHQWALQMIEKKAAVEARRPSVLAAQFTLRLHLPEELQQQPPRLDMCSCCARLLQQQELAEEACRAHGCLVQEHFKQMGMQPAPAGAPAASQGAAGAAAAAAVLPAEGEAQQQQWQPPEQRLCGGGSNAVGAEDSPATPQSAPLPPPQQQPSSSDQEAEQDQDQEQDAADQRHLQLPEAPPPPPLPPPHRQQAF